MTQTDRQTNTQTDIATSRLNRPRGQFSEKYGWTSKYLVLIFHLNSLKEYHCFFVCVFYHNFFFDIYKAVSYRHTIRKCIPILAQKIFLTKFWVVPWSSIYKSAEPLCPFPTADYIAIIEIRIFTYLKIEENLKLQECRRWLFLLVGWPVTKVVRTHSAQAKHFFTPNLQEYCNVKSRPLIKLLKATFSFAFQFGLNIYFFVLLYCILNFFLNHQKFTNISKLC